jgi:hypothetical protein
MERPDPGQEEWEGKNFHLGDTQFFVTDGKWITKKGPFLGTQKFSADKVEL